ncbi:GcrA family cell cycle regulator [Chelativorans salis]|uniref:GcrA family cell cycle regulator n=1 Tax=Chelativorans salis TaxID=2978478 RepID=A0ABT2LJC6_9HYPH|nr:GcrA family cell cycle regulator [Chelativorans sp. EGI FJ00035]MCT7374507.1 GcrA family cell cycle regulator [Chelativorans sp. EGI FJ00035]
MNWTDERVEMLKKLWAEGLSASQIAAQLGGVSRNAVIGKVHRLKLSSRGRAAASPARQKKSTASGGSGGARRQRSSRPITASVGATALKVQFEEDAVAYQRLRPVENVVVPISRNLKLVQLTEHTCKWPNGDPLSEDFSFCGNNAGESSPYCTYHSKLAYQPASERRRNR